MKIERFNIHPRGNNFLIEFQGDDETVTRIIKTILDIVSEELEAGLGMKEEEITELEEKKRTRIAKHHLQRVLDEHEWDLEDAAAVLNIDIPGITRRIKHHGLEKKDDTGRPGRPALASV